ncbi:MAG: hypothetical protein KDA31_14240 [Phycisphaerales bacterium]|nr:hypothetical protein [Phycisphaerales bacterium]MCB9837479.1 hypothetical protein [Phycisphaera sp.]
MWWQGAKPHSLVIEERDIWPDLFWMVHGFGLAISERARKVMVGEGLIEPERVHEVKVLEFDMLSREYTRYEVRYFVYRPEGVVYLHWLPEASIADVKRCVCGWVDEIWDIAKVRRYENDWASHTGQPIVQQITLIEGVPLYPVTAFIVSEEWRDVWEANSLCGADFGLRSAK